MISTEMVLFSETHSCFVFILIHPGRADFLCFKKTGVISGFLNRGVGNMINQGMIKHGEGRERQNKFIVARLVLKADTISRPSNGVSREPDTFNIRSIDIILESRLLTVLFY